MDAAGQDKLWNGRREVYHWANKIIKIVNNGKRLKEFQKKGKTGSVKASVETADAEIHNHIGWNQLQRVKSIFSKMSRYRRQHPPCLC